MLRIDNGRADWLFYNDDKLCELLLQKNVYVAYVMFIVQLIK